MNDVDWGQVAVLVAVLVPSVRRSYRRADWAVVAAVVCIATANLLVVAVQVSRHGTIYPQDRTVEALMGKLDELFGISNEYAAATLAFIAGITRSCGPGSA